MFAINIPSLRDPATRNSLKDQIARAAAIISAFEYGVQDAQVSAAYQRGLNVLMADAFYTIISPDSDVHQQLTEAYNLGWDSVRLNRGVQHG